MKNIDLNALKPLTVITGNNFTGKTELLKKISKEANGKYIGLHTKVEIEVTEWLKHWFRFVFKKHFIQGVRSNHTLKILSLGLNCKEGDLLIVENPEVGLDMGAKSQIAKFFTYLVSQKGIRVLIETNSTQIVTSICYEVFNKNILSDNIVFLHKADKDNIEKTFVNKNGKFCNINQELVKYPSGFFDANTKEIFALI